MRFMDLIFPKKKSAQLAKERLSIIISHERNKEEHADFLPKLRQELMAVISKYVKLDEDQINIEVKRDETHSTIAMNVVLPDLTSLTPQSTKEAEEVVG